MPDADSARLKVFLHQIHFMTVKVFGKNGRLLIEGEMGHVDGDQAYFTELHPPRGRTMRRTLGFPCCDIGWFRVETDP